jgi:CheY-like chemotaxis protein
LKHVRLIHWNTEEVKVCANLLQAEGYQVDCSKFDGPPSLKKIRAKLPAAVVIDLSRAPAQGRDVALAIRRAKSTRSTPLVFIDGNLEKVAGIKAHLPDATYTSWKRFKGALKKAIANPPENPAVPSSNLAGYSNTPLPKKLGIKSGSVVVLIDAPDGFEKTLGSLPTDAVLSKGMRGKCDVTIWFVDSLKDLERRIERIGRFGGENRLWIAWPKKASGWKTDVTENQVRRVGLAEGLVDYKIAAIDSIWSGLLFTRRKT